MKFSRGKLPRIAVHFTVLTVSLLLACFAFVSSQSVSAAPTTMNFQGRLADSSGNIMPNGSYNMQFRLFTVASGGSATWTETRETTNRVTVTNGLFSVQLGSVTPLSASLFSGNDVYFEITLPTPATATCNTASCASWESPMAPRHKMATSAYAFQAENANTLDGLDSTAFAAATGATGYIQNTTSPQTADFAITGTGRIDTELQAPSIQRNAAGSLNIGTTATTTGMTIGSANLVGTLAINSGTASTINIGSTSNARTISIGNVAAVQTVTLGSTNTTSSTTIQGGATGSISLATGGTINLNAGTIATNATTANFLNTTATTVNAFGVATTITMGANSGTATIRNSNVTVGNATTRGTFTNNGATLNSTLALGDLAAGAIGTAAATVNIYTGVTISPTAAGRTYTIPSPTNTAAGRTFYISNINATNNFIILGQTIEPNTVVSLVWGGAAWTISATPVPGANTSLSNLASTNINTALNRTSGDLTLQTTTSGNIILNPVGSVELQKSTNVTGNVAATGTVTGSNLSGTNSGDVSLTGQNYLSIAGQTITVNAINLATGNVTGTLGLANGGTGATTAQGAINAISGLTTNGDLLYHNGTNSTRLARGTNGQCLTSNATTLQWGSCGLSAESDTLATVTARGATTATATTFSGGLTASGTGTGLSVTNNATVGGTLGVTGAITGSNLSGTNTGDVSVSGQNYLSLSGQTITANAVNLGTSNVTGTLGLGNGGTGATTAQGAINAISGLTTNGDLLFHNGSNATRLARGTNGQCLTSNATTIQWGSCGLSAEADTLSTVTGRGASTTTALALQGGATIRGITVETATVTQDQIILAAAAVGASRFAGTITNADLTAARTYTLPNASGTFAVSASGNIALSAAGDISFTGSLTDAQVSDTLTASNLVGSGSTTNAVDLGTAEVAGTLGVANGGTGATTTQGAINAISQLTTNGDLLYHNGTNSTRLARGTNGQCLTSNATTLQWGSCGITAEADTLATVTGRGASTTTAVSLQGGATIRGLTVETATVTQDQIILAAAATGAARFAGTITNADLTAARTYTLPNASGTLAVSASGNIALSAAGDISFTGSLTDAQVSDTLTASNFVGSGSTTNAVDLGTAEVAGTLGVANGGTGATTAQGAINAISQLTTNGDLLYHNGTNSTRLARGTNGQCLTSNATTLQWGSCGLSAEADTLATVTGRGASTTTALTLQGGASVRGLFVDVAAAGNVAVQIQGVAAQTGDLLQIKDSTGTNQMRVLPNGTIAIGNGSESVTNGLGGSGRLIQIGSSAGLNMQINENNMAFNRDGGSYIANRNAGSSASLVLGVGSASAAALVIDSSNISNFQNDIIVSGDVNAQYLGTVGNAGIGGNLNATGTITGSNLSGTNTGNVSLAGQNYLSLAGQVVTANLINMGSHVTGTLGLGNGGTGATTAQGAINAISGLTTNGDLLYHNGTNSTRLARGTNGQCLTSNATTLQWGSCGASTSLNNLTATSINQSLIADGNNTRDLGASGTTWRNGYFGTAVYSLLFDRSSAGALNIGTSNATSINLGTTSGSMGLTMGSTNSGSTVNIRGGQSSITLGETTARINTAAGASEAFVVRDASDDAVFKLDNTDKNGNLITNFGAEVNTTGWAGRTGTTLTQNTNLSHVYYGSGSISAAMTATANAGVNYPIQLAPNTQYNILFTGKATVSGNVIIGYAADGATETTYTNNKTIGTSWTNLQLTFTTPATVNAGAYIFIKQSVATAKTLYIDGLFASPGTNSNFYRENAITLGNSATPVFVGALPGTTLQPTASLFVQQNLNNNYGLVVQGAPGDALTRDIFATTDSSGTAILRVSQALGNFVDIQGGSNFYDRSALTVSANTSTSIVLRVQGASSQSADLLQARNSSGTNLFRVTANGSIALGTDTDTITNPFGGDPEMIQIGNNAGFNLKLAENNIGFNRDGQSYIANINTGSSAGLTLGVGGISANAIRINNLNETTINTSDTTGGWPSGYTRSLSIGGSAGGGSCGSSGCPVLAINTGGASGNRWGIGVPTSAALVFATENGSTATTRVSISNTANLTVAGTNACTIGSGTGNTSCTSDSRLKNIQGDATGNLDKILQLSPAYYTWKSDSTNTVRMGLIAQDVQEVLPEFVITDEQGFLQLDYGGLVAPLIGAVKEQQDQIDSITQQLQNSQASALESITGNMSIGGDLNVMGNASFVNLTVAQNLTVEGDALVVGKVTAGELVVAGHITTKGATPTVAHGVALGEGETLGASIEGTDGAGTLTVTSATSTTSGAIAAVSFAAAYETDYKIIVSARDENAAKLRVYAVKTDTGFEIRSLDALDPNATYTFDYITQGATSL